MVTQKNNILTKEECDELISLGRDKMVIASTLGKQIDGYRTADNTWIYEKTLLTDKIKSIVSEYTNTPISHQESIHIVRYGKGGEYKTHHDFFHPNTDYYDNVMQNGGNRTHSVLFYLNDDFEGGETEFPKLNIKVTPELGKLLIWENMNSDGTLNYDSLHAGLPVIDGEKWILIIWIRENKFS